MAKPQLLDHRGNPIERSTLTREISAATHGGVRSPISGTPADGLNPVRLANILRETDQGDPLRFLELAEVIEERDPHYLGVLGTRKRSVGQIPITIEAGGESQHDENMAELVRGWLDRDELADELFDILDSIGKGYSFTEIIWDTSERQIMPLRLEFRDPRWFRFDRRDLNTPVMLDDHGQELPLPAFKFIHARMKAKSGLALRSGLARVATWGWMFKAFAQRDWAIFTQTYGQPLRVGKFGNGASEADQETLFQAVANIAGDCAAIIPEDMSIDFIESKSIGSSMDLYERRSDWLDKQISKAVLGQTATTDAETGGLGSGKEHREVQQVIERADATALAAILNRDLIRPWIDLEYGPQENYPRLKIARPEPEDIAGLASALGVLVPLGLRVKEAQVMEKLGLELPSKGDLVLGISAPPSLPDDVESASGKPASILKGVGSKIKRGSPLPDATTALNAQTPPAALKTPLPETVILADQLENHADPIWLGMVDAIEAMMEVSGSLIEFRQNLLAAYPDLNTDALSEIIAQALASADLGGRVASKV